MADATLSFHIVKLNHP